MCAALSGITMRVYNEQPYRAFTLTGLALWFRKGLPIELSSPAVSAIQLALTAGTAVVADIPAMCCTTKTYWF